MHSLSIAFANTILRTHWTLNTCLCLMHVTLKTPRYHNKSNLQHRILIEIGALVKSFRIFSSFFSRNRIINTQYQKVRIRIERREQERGQSCGASNTHIVRISTVTDRHNIICENHILSGNYSINFKLLYNSSTNWYRTTTKICIHAVCSNAIHEVPQAQRAHDSLAATQRGQRLPHRIAHRLTHSIRPVYMSVVCAHSITQRTKRIIRFCTLFVRWRRSLWDIMRSHALVFLLNNHIERFVKTVCV